MKSSERGRKVLMGTCGVEVDTSTYAIPSPISVGRWVNAVIPGFLFHFKAFGLFCSKSGAVTTIPNKIRSKMALPDAQNVRLYDLPCDIRDELWNIFNSALQPAYQAGRLGVVVFQFHLSFKPSDDNQAHVVWCRKHLDSRYPMAVEFRCREWFIGEQLSKTERWLASNSLALISADELEHETFQRDREQTGLAPGQRKMVLPTAWPSTFQDFLYIRVHRREGTQRLLSDEELQSWEVRLSSQLPLGLKGPIYFMWGTDWEDQPLVNAKRLLQRLPKELAFDWKSMQKANSRLQSMFMAVSSKVQQSTNPGQVRECSEDPACPPSTMGLAQITEQKTKPLRGYGIDVEEEETSGTCPSSDQISDGPEPCPAMPLPLLDSPSCQNNVDDGVIPKELVSKRKCEVNPVYEDFESKKRVVLSSPLAKENGTDGPGFVKSVPETKQNFSPKKQGKVIQGRKFQAASSTPTITSFFKRATSRDS